MSIGMWLSDRMKMIYNKLRSLFMGFKWMVYVALVLLWSGCKGKKDNTYQDIVRPVRVVNVESLGAINKLYTGVVEAEEYSNLAFKLSAADCDECG